MEAAYIAFSPFPSTHFSSSLSLELSSLVLPPNLTGIFSPVRSDPAFPMM